MAILCLFCNQDVTSDGGGDFKTSASAVDGPDSYASDATGKAASDIGGQRRHYAPAQRAEHGRKTSLA